MSSTAPRYHIPFPSHWLPVNAHGNTTTPTPTAVVPAGASFMPHNFLSNQPTASARHLSVSSVSSDESTLSSAPASPQLKAADAPGLGYNIPAFLALNSKFKAPTTPKTPINEKSAFLSNQN